MDGVNVSRVHHPQPQPLGLDRRDGARQRAEIDDLSRRLGEVQLQAVALEAELQQARAKAAEAEAAQQAAAAEREAREAAAGELEVVRSRLAAAEV